MLRTILLLCIVLMCFNTFAADGIPTAGVFDTVLDRFKESSERWATRITDAATWLFFTLATISFVWTFGQLALKKAEMGEIMAELVIFVITTGFFLWLLRNGPEFTFNIIDGLRQLAGEASRASSSLYPSDIVDIGFNVFGRVMSASSIWSPVDSLIGFIMGTVIIIICALIAVNMSLLIISAWILGYAGIFFLGFGGSKWTSDMAINYYRTSLGVGIQIFAMILIIGIGDDIIKDFEAKMSDMNLSDMAVILVVSIFLLMLVEKVPALLAGIITGQSVGGMGVGAFGAGAAVGAAAATAAAAGMATKALEGFAAQTMGVGSAIGAAFKETQNNMQSGGGMFAGASGGGALGMAGTFAADMAKNLSGGVAAETKSMFNEAMASTKEAVSETFGGRVAEQISPTPPEGGGTEPGAAGAGAEPASTGDSSGSASAQSSAGDTSGMSQSAQDEINDFVNRGGN